MDLDNPADTSTADAERKDPHYNSPLPAGSASGDVWAEATTGLGAQIYQLLPMREICRATWQSVAYVTSEIRLDWC